MKNYIDRIDILYKPIPPQETDDPYIIKLGSMFLKAVHVCFYHNYEDTESTLYNNVKPNRIRLIHDLCSKRAKHILSDSSFLFYRLTFLFEPCQDKPVFDRFDICEAHYLLEADYNVSGILQERRSNHRSFKSGNRIYTGHSTDAQLHRMGFKPSPMLSYETLSDNGKAIYDRLVIEYGLDS